MEEARGRQLLGVRDVLVELLETEAQSRDDVPRMAELRTALNDRYDRYVGHYGPVNRFTWAHSGRFDPITGEEKMRRLRPAQGGFRLDTYAPAVMALEEFDAVSQRASKASVFQRRAVAPRVRRLGADSPADALAICLDERGTVDLDEIGRLLGRDPQAARLALGSLVFEEPGAGGRLVAAAEYLSGDVRAKLAVAEAASREDPRWVENASALRAVVPAELGPGEIDARLGATWIGASDVQLFLRQTLEDPHLVVEHPGASTWTVRGNSYGVAATVRWGTARAPAPRLAQALLEQRQISIHDELDGGGRTLNLTDTTAAREKAEELNERFSAWVWEDPERSSRLSKHYNDLFNGIALRSYDGAELSLPGMAEAFEPASHQVAAVARIVAEPTVLLAHDVGAGKTAEMVIGSQELRRLGLVKKPGFVVPNHMLEQFGREFLQIYPRARVLVADKDAMDGPNRREFVARSATGDWDAVILSRSACERIPMSAASRRDYIDAELAVVRKQLAAARDGDRRTVKRIERELLAAEERLKGKLDTERRDAGVSWEQTGIDYLFVVEAHGYKNLRTASNIQGAAIDGSQRADDLAMKLHYLRQTHRHRVATFATATPIANSVTETYVVQRYLQPDLLARAGIEDFDSWAANFGRVVTEVELAPAGNEYRLQSRFARFRNVPELLRLLHVSADVKTAEDLKLARPAVAGSGPETVVVECSQELAAYVEELGHRADLVRSRGVSPEDDNMLKVSNDGRLAALDLRLVGRGQGGDVIETKAAAAADRIAQIWVEHRNAQYAGLNGSLSPVRGALQLVFCDQGTPRPGWNVYDELRDQLEQRGVPREQVRFMHEARNDREKGELFAACRQGRVAVLIGSTERMGVGTNVQARAVALHHLDCPWRPADLAQRDGRILRQGNQNPEVRILRYVTEGSFDTYLWQTVERKARFIGQVMRGRLDTREIEDIGDTALSYAEVKALAAGDTRLMEKAKLEGEVVRLERLERAWHRTQRDLQYRVERGPLESAVLEEKLKEIGHALARRQPTKGEQFQMQVDGSHYSERATAGEALAKAAQRACLSLPTVGSAQAPIGSLGGFTLEATVRREADAKYTIELQLAGVPDGDLQLGDEQLRAGSSTGLVVRLENRLEKLEAVRDRALADLQRAQEELARGRAQLQLPFPHTAALGEARSQAARLTAELGELAQPKEPRQPDTGANAATSASQHPPRVDSRPQTPPADPRRSWIRRASSSPADQEPVAPIPGPQRAPEGP